jgi:drug/metabolite transporter (DMT)-like permease
MSTLTKRIISPDKLVWAGALLIAALGLIHLVEAPDELEEATYLGLLFLANFGGAVVAAIGIYRNYRWGWLFGVMLAGGSFVGYVVSRTMSLPGLPVEEWLQPLGVLALLVEALFVGLYLTIFVRLAKEARTD